MQELRTKKEEAEKAWTKYSLPKKPDEESAKAVAEMNKAIKDYEDYEKNFSAKVADNICDLDPVYKIVSLIRGFLVEGEVMRGADRRTDHVKDLYNPVKERVKKLLEDFGMTKENALGLIKETLGDYFSEHGLFSRGVIRTHKEITFSHDWSEAEKLANKEVITLQEALERLNKQGKICSLPIQEYSNPEELPKTDLLSRVEILKKETSRVLDFIGKSLSEAGAAWRPEPSIMNPLIYEVLDEIAKEGKVTKDSVKRILEQKLGETPTGLKEKVAEGIFESLGVRFILYKPLKWVDELVEKVKPTEVSEKFKDELSRKMKEGKLDIKELFEKCKKNEKLKVRVKDIEDLYGLLNDLVNKDVFSLETLDAFIMMKGAQVQEYKTTMKEDAAEKTARDEFYEKISEIISSLV